MAIAASRSHPDQSSPICRDKVFLFDFLMLTYVSRKLDGNEKVGLALAFLAVTAFSLTLPMTRLAVADLGALSVAVWRGLIAGFAALILLIVLRPRRPRGRQWRDLVACAFGTVFGFPIFTALAMETVSASHGAVVVALLPIATAVVGVLISNERPSLGFWLASLFGTAVTFVFVWRQAEGGLTFGHIYLIFAVITAGIGYAYGGLLARDIKGWVVACWSLVASLPVLAGLVVFVPPLNLHAEVVTLGAFFYLALISQLGGFFAWYRSMALAGIARASQVQLLQLFFTVGFAVLLLSESWDVEVIAFGAVVAMTVWLTTRLRVHFSN